MSKKFNFKKKFEEWKAKLKNSNENELPTASALKDNLENALMALPNELEDNLLVRVNRFFAKPKAYQQKHLDNFIDGLVVAIEGYVVPAEVSKNQYHVKDYSQIKHDVLANIALALASLLIFYPLVLGINSYRKGQNYGFFRMNDGRNESNLIDNITIDQDTKLTVKNNLEQYKTSDVDQIEIVREYDVPKNEEFPKDELFL